MLDMDGFSATVAAIYDAAIDVERWEGALASLAGLFDSPKAQISYFRSPRDPDAFVKLWGFSAEELERGYRPYLELSASDPRAPPATFKAYHCRQIVSDDVLRASAMYRRALAPAGIEYGMYFTLALDEGATCAACVMRGSEGVRFTAEDCEDFARLIPHVSRAASIHGTLRRAREAVAAARALIEAVPMGMLIVDDGKVLLANIAARAVLDGGEGLRRFGGRIKATSARGEARLAAAIAAARGEVAGPIGITLPAGEAGQIRVVVRSLAPATSAMFGGGEGAVALYLADSRNPLDASAQVLRHLFGLTGREAAVLAALIGGDDARRIGARLAIGEATVRTHLRHVMQAIGVSRQTDLVRTVLSSPAWIGGHAPGAREAATLN